MVPSFSNLVDLISTSERRNTGRYSCVLSVSHSLTDKKHSDSYFEPGLPSHNPEPYVAKYGLVPQGNQSGSVRGKPILVKVCMHVVLWMFNTKKCEWLQHTVVCHYVLSHLKSSRMKMNTQDCILKQCNPIRGGELGQYIREVYK